MRDTLANEFETSGRTSGGYEIPISIGNTAPSLVPVDIDFSESQPKRLKVAAYCRVSTDEEIQLNSLQNQIIHYTNHIRTNPEWQFAGIFSDRGTTGTNTVGREGFNRMVRHALAGKVDLIICKSISRFARNVLDTLNTVRLLKEHGVRIIFENDGIDTGSMQSEFVITLLAAIFQEESRNISENITWSNTKRFERGEVIFTRMLGYRKYKGKDWVIVKEEAEVVKEAFEFCNKGTSPAQIAKLFIKKGYKKANGRCDWSATAIRDILRNERYTGDALCQKTYTKDYLSHRAKQNDGGRNQYLIKDHHEAIIDRETYDKAQEMLLKRGKPSATGKRKSYALSGRLLCGECGGNLQRYICRGVVTWRCGNRMKSKRLCSLEGIKEEYILEALIKAFYKKYRLNKNHLGKDLIRKMTKEIQGAELTRAREQRQWILKLEQALLEENVAIINLREDGDLKAKRIALEEEIAEKELCWKLFDQDDEYRMNTLEILDNMKFMDVKATDLEENIKNIDFLRAWVMRIKVLSPISFSITWINGEEININIKKGEDKK